MGNVLKLLLGFGFIIVVVGLSYNVYLLSHSEESRQLHEKVERLREENAVLAHHNRRLVERIEALKHDSRAIERAIRDELGLVRPDEVVIHFRQAPVAEE